nr:DUF2142 domain-containing protein [uncultured Bacillus sp.]
MEEQFAKINRKIHYLFLMIVIPAGIFWAYLIPPFQTPDETVHFYRAYEISEGHVLSSHDENGRIGNYFPAAIKEFIDKVRLDEIIFHPEKKLSHQDLEEAKQIELSGERIFYYFPSSAIYSPIPYLPQALGIFIARGLDMSVYHMTIASRILNLITYAMLTFFAIKIIPRLKTCLFLLALMPMTLHQAASISGDSLLFGVAFLMIAYIFRLIFSEETTTFTLKDFSILLALSAAVSLAKPAYFLFFLMLFLIPVKKYKNKRIYWKYNSIIGVISLAVLFGWMAFGNKAPMPTDPVEQAKWILLHPVQYAKQLIGTFIYDDQLYLQFVGVLGWLDTHIPYVFSILFTILFTASITLEKCSEHKNKATFIRGLLLLGFFLAEAAIVVTLLFIGWPQNDSHRVYGVQGRYFIPIFLIGAYSLYVILPWLKKRQFAFYLLAVVIAFLFSSYCLYLRFYQ